MPAALYNNFVVEQGATFSYILTWKNSNGTPIDLTGYTARMSIKENIDDTTPVVTLTTENGRIALGGVAGTITLTIPAATTTTISFENGVYDLELINGSVITRLIQGAITFSKEVTT